MVVHGVRAEMASAAQEHSLLGMVEARTLKGSIVHRFIRTMVPTEDGGRSRIVYHVLLRCCRMRAGLVRACSVLE